MSKWDRRNHNRQRQLDKQTERRLEKSIFTGHDGVPRIVAVISLCNNTDAAAVVRTLGKSMNIDVSITADTAAVRVPINRFRQQLQFIISPPDRNVMACMDVARVADFVIFVLSAVVEVDELGELILRSVESQGLSTSFTVVNEMEKIETGKQQMSVLESLKLFMRHFNPDRGKPISLSNRQECANLMRLLCNATPKGVHWRDERSWMLVEEISFEGLDSDATILAGVIRGSGLSVDRLIQVGDWGAFRIDKITFHPRTPKKEMVNDYVDAATMQTNMKTILATPCQEGDDVHSFALRSNEFDGDGDTKDEGVCSQSLATSNFKGVLLDEHRYFDRDEDDRMQPAKRLPRGTSTYQSAWILDDATSESEVEIDDDEIMEDDECPREPVPANRIDDFALDVQLEVSELTLSKMSIEPNEGVGDLHLAQNCMRKRIEAKDDLEFPDEIELHPHVPARERLARYRGLKNPRFSPWDEKKDQPYEPRDWKHMLHVHDFHASLTRTARKIPGNVAPGTRVSIHIAKGAIPAAVRSAYNSCRPMMAFSLLRHEHEQSVVNFLLNLSANHSQSIKSKEELVVQCGPRRFVANPLFSQSGNTPNDVHRYCRFIHPGQSVIATFIGPITSGSVPTLFFKRTKAGAVPHLPDTASSLCLIGTGTSLAPSVSRVVAKRVVLTGHPYHIHKNVVTIRHMFFNREDVEFFKALPLWTKCGRCGYIKESLGTHGYFKASFDGRINPQDSVAVSLYKRVWPRKSMLYQEWTSPHIAIGVEARETMDEAIILKNVDNIKQD